MAVEPRVLLVWGQYPRWIPPVQFSARQVTPAARVKPGLQDQSTHNFNYFDAFEPDGWLGTGAFDLLEYCERNRLGRDFDFIITFGEEDMGLLPTNLDAFGCPAILLVGDTHHFRRPISTLISYAKRENIGMVATQFASHHLHWFIKAGIELCAWTPGLITRHAPRDLSAARDDRIAFIGHFWNYHYHRYCLLNEMRAAGLPLDVRIGTRDEAADAYAQSLISFNCSLNSDINIRNYEVLSSGGFLLTDELPEVTGFRELFRPGQACEVYRDRDELFDKIAFYRRNPDAAFAIAAQGNRLFSERLTPELAVARFKQAFFEDGGDRDLLPPDPRCREPADPNWSRRLQAYEDVQELHRTRNAVRVLIGDDADWLRPEDFVDLPLVTFYSAKPRPGQKVEEIDPRTIGTEYWDYVAGD